MKPQLVGRIYFRPSEAAGQQAIFGALLPHARSESLFEIANIEQRDGRTFLTRSSCITPDAHLRALNQNDVAIAKIDDGRAWVMELPTMHDLWNSGIIKVSELILMLGRRFECLEYFFRHHPRWDPDELDRQACKFSSGEIAAARFILTVWNAREKWKCGRFDAVDAVAHWSHHDRQAFTDWCMDPWWA